MILAVQAVAGLPAGGGCRVLDLAEVRVLGPFRVRTATGDLVDPRAWRTAKTRDLVRLLALAGGDPVPIEAIVDALWPASEPPRGRASVRTAASQVRQVFGEDHLVRTGGGLALKGAWVDALAFAGLAGSAGHLLATGDRASGVTTAWEAVNLYSGDLCEDEPYAEWVQAERERYRSMLRGLLLDAADAAGELCWFRDASELAHRALLLDSCAERAYRTLMRAHARLGETELAFGMYERCRRCLADELGVDPSAETQALHLSLLRAAPVDLPSPRFVGHEAELATVEEALREAAEERRAVGVLVSGPAGSGRSSFVRQVLQRWPHRVVEVRLPSVESGSPEGPGSDALARALSGDVVAMPRQSGNGEPPLLGEPLLVVVEDLHRAVPGDLAALDRALDRDDSPVSVLATLNRPAAAHPRLAAGPRWREVTLLALAPEQVHVVLESVLGGAPSAALADEVYCRTGGLPGPVVDVAAALMRAGGLLATSDGLVTAPASADHASGREDARLARVRDQSGGTGGQVLDILAVLNRPTSVGALAALTGVDLGELAAVLGQLTDHGVLARSGGLIGFRDAVTREAAYRWLRPTVRERLHRVIAETADLPAHARVDHWLRCGEPALACAAALQAADAALARGDDSQARVQLLRVRAFAVEHVVDPADRIELDESLSEVAERLGRRVEARTLIEDALVLARADAPEMLARLYRRLGRLARTSADALLAYEAISRTPELDPGQRLASTLAVASASTGVSPDTAGHVLQLAVEEADAAGDVGAQVEARVLLARAAGLTRDFPAANRAGKAALALAEAVGDDALFIRAAHALVQTPAYLGSGLQVLGLTQRAWQRSLAMRDPVVIGEIGRTYCLVLHDLGSPEFGGAWRAIEGLARRGGKERLHCLLDALFSLERGELTRADRLLQAVPRGVDTAAGDHAELLLGSRLSLVRDDVQAAVTSLTAIVEDPRAATVTLLVPEAAARLALILAPVDQEAAVAYVARAVEAGGAQLHPREHVCLLEARAALLSAAGRPGEGATVALAAALAARQAGLVRPEAGATRLREELIRVAVTDLGPGPQRSADRRRLSAAGVSGDVDGRQQAGRSRGHGG